MCQRKSALRRSGRCSSVMRRRRSGERCEVPNVRSFLRHLPIGRRTTLSSASLTVLGVLSDFLEPRKCFRSNVPDTGLRSPKWLGYSAETASSNAYQGKAVHQKLQAAGVRWAMGLPMAEKMTLMLLMECSCPGEQ